MESHDEVLLLLGHFAEEAVMLMLTSDEAVAAASDAHFGPLKRWLQRYSSILIECSTARARLALLQQREWPLAHWATWQSTTDADLISATTTCLQCTCSLPLCHCRLSISLHLFSLFFLSLFSHVVVYASRSSCSKWAPLYETFFNFFCIKVTDSNLHCSPVIKSFVCRRLKWSLVTSFGLCLPSKGAYLPIDYDKIRIAIQIYQAVTLRHTLVINRIKRWLNLPTGTWYHGHGALSYSRLRLHVAPGAKTHPTHWSIFVIANCSTLQLFNYWY